MTRIGILYQPERQASSILAQEAQELLRGASVDVWQGAAQDDAGLAAVASDLDILMTLGGDGTIVRASRAVAAYDVPILGVNLGRLGFLAEVEPANLAQAVRALLERRYFVEERMMLNVELLRQGERLVQAEAINDAVVARGLASRTVHVAVYVDDQYVMTPASDGVIVSTPTGSTAYCLAAGGPIVAPDLNCLTLTPVAAHLGLTHALVIPSHRQMCLELVRGEGAIMTLDGQMDTPLQVGDRAIMTASSRVARFVRFGSESYFYGSVLKRLRWPDQHVSR